MKMCGFQAFAENTVEVGRCPRQQERPTAATGAHPPPPPRARGGEASTDCLSGLGDYFVGASPAA